MRIRVEFDNEANGEHVDLGPEDLTLSVEGRSLAPSRIEEGFVAWYELPNNTPLEIFAEALDGSAWCHAGFRVEEEAPDPAP